METFRFIQRYRWVCLAARWLVLETVSACEIDKFAMVLNKPSGKSIHNDIRTLNGAYAGIDIITGYPRQPLAAGKAERRR